MSKGGLAQKGRLLVESATGIEATDSKEEKEEEEPPQSSKDKDARNGQC